MTAPRKSPTGASANKDSATTTHDPSRFESTTLARAWQNRLVTSRKREIVQDREAIRDPVGARQFPDAELQSLDLGRRDRLGAEEQASERTKRDGVGAVEGTDGLFCFSDRSGKARVEAERHPCQWVRHEGVVRACSAVPRGGVESRVVSPRSREVSSGH